MSSQTILRSLEYERLEGLTLRGRTLDVGGGSRNSDYSLLRFEGEVESVNIDLGIRPSVVADLNRGLPLGSAKFDNIISFNTFEHIRQDTTAVRESLRVLKPGGSFHIIVPFLYHVHGSPSDYHRHTLHWWTEFMLENGADLATFQVEPLVWDRLSSAYSFIGHGRLGRIIKVLVTAVPVVKDFFLGGGKRLPDTGKNRAMLNLALGYYMHGTKCR